MNPETVATVLAAFLLGLTLLPLVALSAGRRAARRRRAAEAPHRHPRPALHGPLGEGVDPELAYAAGRRAAQASYGEVRDVVEALRERHRLLAEVTRHGEVWKVRLAGLANDTLRRGGPGCHYDRGLLAEAFARMGGAPVEIQEVGCGALGNERCEFAIRPLPRAEGPSRLSPGAAGSQRL